MTGYSRVDIMQKSGNCSYLYGDQTTQEMKERLMQALDGQTKEQLEILLYKKNRTPLWLMVYIAPVVNERAETVLMLLTFRNITALKTPLDDDDSNKAGLNKFARLARSVTRNRTMLQQVASATPTPQPASGATPDWNLLSPEMADTRHPGRSPGSSSISRTPSPHPGDEHNILSPTPKAQADLEKGAAKKAYIRTPKCRSLIGSTTLILKIMVLASAFSSTVKVAALMTDPVLPCLPHPFICVN
ncbi:hypothetical protein ACTXT7_004611 [Hymenolepis weldensis]